MARSPEAQAIYDEIRRLCAGLDEATLFDLGEWRYRQGLHWDDLDEAGLARVLGHVRGVIAGRASRG